ncbi:G2/M phase-specific E3 ubiquitin-protein ligase-like [Carassius carassius]|uniref:G2/M phase-specific E3 ubiquitin-protein ligase-like n=1 Tax=Carassius carassius TaxID=217509 RepID=UPI0028692BF0|nr:G2/M phase-specific E3 ubiquitin-protein ligase-like [Carassius carassius]
MAEVDEAAAGALQQAIGVLRNILSSPETVTSLASSLERPNTGSSARSTTYSTVESEMRTLFRPGSSVGALAGQAANVTQGQTGGLRQSMRYQTQKHFGSWSSRSRKRAKTQFHDTFNKYVILLPTPSSSVVVKHRIKQQLHEQGHILNGFEFQKSWDHRTVTEQIRDAFGEKLSANVSIEFLMACGHKLITPKLRAGQELDASLIHIVYKSKALYIRPSKPILVEEDSYCSEESNCEENSGSARQRRSSSLTQNRHSDSFTSLMASGSPPNCTLEVQPFASSHVSGALFSQTPALTNQRSNSPNHSSNSTSYLSSQLPVCSLEICPSTSQPITSSFRGTISVNPPLVDLTGQSFSSSPNQSSSFALASTYDSYLSVMSALSDMSSDDEELNQAILASLQSERQATGCPVPAKDILQDLAKKINHQKKCKFNINRYTVLDGAIRGFKRGTYDPCHTISVRFSDDMGIPEEAVDLGGPRREFLRLLIEALLQSSMFEGDEDKMNLALDSTAMREDRYFIAGRAIAVSLVHGGPPPGFLSPTLFSSLVDGPELAKPGLEDIADKDLHEKIKRITESKSFEELLASTEPLEEYLATAGCLKPLRRMEDKNQLVDDILMFQVIHRVRGPFERFRDGLKTLGVLDKIQAHPESFRPLLCWSPTTLTADLVDNLFTIRLSPVGSNRRHTEEVVVPFWRDYLTDAEDQEGTQKLETILAFATGANTVPPIGFFPQPSVEFLHREHDAESTSKLPIANTCINCLKLPLHTTYRDFQENMDFALGNTHGFGIK